MTTAATRIIRSIGPLVALTVLSLVVWRPTLGIVVQGALIGSLSALLAIGLALVYRANKIVNFAQGDLGVVPAVLAILLIADDVDGGPPDWITGQPYVVGLVVGVVAAMALGALVERLFILRFSRAPRLVLTVATIGIAQILAALALFMPGWFGFNQAGAPALDPPLDVNAQIGGVVFDDNDLMVFLAVPILLGALAWFLRATDVGIAIRGVAERADRAAMLGIPIGRIQTTVWVITTVLAFATVFLRAGVLSFPIGSALGVSVLVRALAAAVIGRMTMFPRIAGAAIGLGIVEQSIIYETGRDVYVFPVLFAIIVVALILNRRTRGDRVEDDMVSTWQAVRELRRIPSELARVPEVRAVRYGGAALLVVGALTLPLWLAESRLFIATESVIIGVVAVSLVLLTGWSGHVSLGQMAFAAIGGAVGGWVTQSAGLDLAIAFVVGGIAGALVALVVGVPAVRAGGLTLAIVTLAMASATLYWLLNPEFFPWVPRGRFAEDPVLFGRLQIDSETSFYYLSIAVLVLIVAMTKGIRNSRSGRVLIALRENHRAAESYGVSALRATLSAFSMSGFMAAVAGVLLVHHQHALASNVVGNPFSPEASLRVFTIVVIGGLGSIGGSILGVVYVFTMQYYMLPEYRFLATGIGLLALLLVLPGGIGAGLAEARDAVLRWLAKRRDILVPSLVADRSADGFEVPAEAGSEAETDSESEPGSGATDEPDRLPEVRG
ncbi:MAG: ABC transporter permease [Acidimicrobiales bacterium]|nr:ABC transporter permease [Acidimicrobiales bacterium]